MQSLDAYLEQQTWQIAEVKAGLAEADRGEFASDEAMKAIVAKYANQVDEADCQQSRNHSCQHRA